ncbi:hypothetical protein VHEMI02836 [[Torrubiella] hemipterigena]|uniref:ABC transporter domain-containing protein n=1 Tax=[Torrubiella] hemipterigena TaxID=1531966 RepID=A0A0A1SQT8_9HYPO|nr:hypothetical protein VHEMI02836 [[Torrubiella] hemipterigena]
MDHPEGNGKSTLPLAILNLVSYRGSIKIDGREVRDIPPDVLKRRITVVTERPILIPGTVRQNLLPEEFIVDPEDPEPAMIALEHILGRLELWDTLIEQGGMTTDISKIVFSEDQWQRFSLAQALTTHLYQQNKIVIVNNVTSHVNEASRAVMQEVMNESFGKCTRIITGHMPSAVRGAHILYLVRNRRVIPHEEVIAAANNAASSSGGSAPNQPPPAPGQASGSTPRQKKQTHQQPQAEASGSQPRQSTEASGSRTQQTHAPAEASGSGSRAAQPTTSSSTEHPTTLSSSSSGTTSRARRPAPQPQGSARGKQPQYDQRPPAATYRQPVPLAFHNPPPPRTTAETNQPPSKYYEKLRAMRVVPPAPAGYPASATAQPRQPQSRGPSKEDMEMIKEFLAFVQKPGRRDMSLDEYLDLRRHDPRAQHARRWGPNSR